MADAKQGFMELFDAHGAALMGMLRRLCGRRQDAEDLFQETAARAWKNSHSRPRLRNPRSWVLTIGYRVFADSCARRSAGASLPEVGGDPRWDPGRLAEEAEEADRVQVAMSRLSPAVREVVVLHYMGGLSLRQTAEAMGISEGTVKSRLSAALAELRSVLA